MKTSASDVSSAASAQAHDDEIAHSSADETTPTTPPYHQPSSSLAAPPNKSHDDNNISEKNENTTPSSSAEVRDNTTAKAKHLAPEPPRWRFVKDAKKSLGYSSLAAGHIVVGKSAQELGAKYIPPTISQGAEEVEEREVGKLVVREWEVAEEDVLEEGIKWKRMREDGNQEDEAEEGGEKEGTEDDGNKEISGESESDDNGQPKYKEQLSKYEEWNAGNMAKASDVESPPEPISITSPKSAVVENSTTKAPTIPEEIDATSHISPTQHEEKDLSELGASTASKEVTPLMMENEGTPEAKRRNKRLCLALFLIPLLIAAAIVVGIVFGKDNDSANNREADKRASIITGDETAIISSDSPSVFPSGFPSIAPTNIASSSPSALPSTDPSPILSSVPSTTQSATPSKVPSSMPSILPSSIPTPECPQDMLLFSIEYMNAANLTNLTENSANYTNGLGSTIITNSTISWTLRDVCSGEVMLECLPCALNDAPTSRPSSLSPSLSLETIFIPSDSGTSVAKRDQISEGGSQYQVDERKNANLFGDIRSGVPSSSRTALDSDNLFENGPIRFNGEDATIASKRPKTSQFTPQSFSKCLSYDNEFLFEVSNTAEPGSCCGFDLTTYSMSYGGIFIVEEGSVKPTLLEENESVNGNSTVSATNDTTTNGFMGKIFFGEKRAQCPTQIPSILPTHLPSTTPSAAPSMMPSIAPSNVPISSPSSSPSNDPTVDPSYVPSIFPSFSPTLLPTTLPSELPSTRPSSNPSPLPSTSSPSASPVLFLGRCPKPFVPLTFYNIGARVERNGLVYECIDYSCGSYSFEPGSITAWKTVGSCGGSFISPSSFPSSIPSDSPTGSPTVTLSSSPSNPSSQYPSGMPSISPTREAQKLIVSTKSPSFSPISFIGECPPAFEPLSYYAVGTVIALHGIVFECINFSCGTYGFEPDPADEVASDLWLSAWRIIGTCATLSPTLSPTKIPSTNPSFTPSNRKTPSPTASAFETSYPTQSKTTTPSTPPSSVPTGKSSAKPTCTEGDANFNVCFAIDQSGSVCNGGFSGFDCTNCQPSFFCKSNGVSIDTCCSNFQDVKDFSQQMVVLLDDISVDSLFSIVQFSTGAFLTSDLSTAEQTIIMLDDLQYAGGLTNQAEAFELCQQSFQSKNNSGQGWKNLIVMITDGVPTSPIGGIAKTEALQQAQAAKDSGTYIIPVLISPRFDFFGNERVEFMESIASGESGILNVDGFDGLDTLTENLLGQILCHV